MPPHEVLGIRPGASRDEVTEAFRHYALRHHPDRGGDPAVFQAGLEAYRRLTGARHPQGDVVFRRPQGDVVFHPRRRPGIPSLLRVAGRRLAAALSHR